MMTDSISSLKEIIIYDARGRKSLGTGPSDYPQLLSTWKHSALTKQELFLG